MLAVNIFVIGLLAFALSMAKDRKEQEVRTTIENVALLLDHNITEMVDKIDLSLRETSYYLEREMRSDGYVEDRVGNAVLAEQRAWLSGLATLKVIDASGTFRYEPSGVIAGQKSAFVDRDFFIKHRSQRYSGLIVANPTIGPVNKIWLISFSRRYNNPDGSFAGVILADVGVSDFFHLLTGLDLGPHGIAQLRDTNAALITSYPPTDGPSGQIGARSLSRELADIIASGVEAETFHTRQTQSTVERIETYHRLSAMPFHLVVGMGAEDYLAQWRADVTKAIYVALIFLLVTTVSGWLLWRSFKSSENANARSRLLLRNASDGIQILDARGNIIEVSDSFCRMLGYSRTEVMGMNLVDCDAKYSAAELTEVITRQFEQPEISTFETRRRRKDGTIFDVEVTGHRLELDGQPILFYSARDITERKRIEAYLRIGAVAFESREGMIVTDADGVIIRVNRSFMELTGYEADEVIGKTPRLLHSGRQNADFYAAMWRMIENDGFWQGEIWNRRKNGEIYPEWLTITAVRDPEGEITHYVGSFSDITQRIEDETKIRNLAFYDPLTQLPNRRLLMDRLHQALVASTRSSRKRALLFVDLDDFKLLNDTLGHEKGDLLLQEIARRLTSCVREADTVARLGGDEFVVMLDDLSENPVEAAAQAEIIGEKILATVGQPILLEGHECRSTPSIGITLFGDQRDSVVELLKQADIAMYQAKAAGRNTMRFFSPELQAVVRARASLEEDLRQGIRCEQFVLHYQPQVRGGSLIGAEALIRWMHPERGMVLPGEFIPLAEETGLILPLGNWVLETACRQIAAWATQKQTAHIILAVNVSARQFRQPNFVQQVLTVIDRTGANPQKLKLELTESMLVDNVEDIITKMTVLKSRGLSFSLDDFGTGYSSLSYLKRLPLDQLKIDQSFVRDVLMNSNDGAIAQTIIALGQTMGLSVIAEGVETEQQRDFLARLGCHSFQGYLFSQPLPLEDFQRLLPGFADRLAAVPQ
jgi:diguanylate cyclase (GGDEF)-like protein/PAS domain S-box-containing protein